MCLAEVLFNLQTREERRDRVLDRLPVNYIPEGENKAERELSQARDYSEILNRFVEDYIQLQINQNNNRDVGSVLENENLRTNIREILDEFFEENVVNIFEADGNENIFSMSGADNLHFANKVTRSLSTKLGNLWEIIALISPYAINPEQVFGFKIKGIDLIIVNYNTNALEYIQLKTTRGTLTGSQITRAGTELSIHQCPVFAAAFDITPWTFNHDTIPRVAGEQFWGRIGIDYDVVRSEVIQFISRIDDSWADYA
jgi:hypothetical protein